MLRQVLPGLPQQLTHSIEDPIFKAVRAMGLPFPFPGLMGGSPMTPAVDLAENDKEYTVHAELPGIARKDIDVSITDCNTITIAAQTAAGRNMEKDKEKEENKSEEGSGSGGQRWLAQERAQTTLMRSITLPSAIRGNELKASFKDGLLTLVVPKHQSERIKVEVQDASSS